MSRTYASARITVGLGLDLGLGLRLGLHLKNSGGGVVQLHCVSTHPHTLKIRGGGVQLHCASAYPLTHTLQKFGGRGGTTPLRIRVSTHPHTLKIRGEGWSNSTAHPRIHSPTHSKNSGGGVVQLHCVSAYPLTHTL